MFSRIKTAFSPSALHGPQGSGSVRQAQQGQGSIAQQNARPRQSGGGTLAGTAREQGTPTSEGLHQQSAPRSTGRSRFQAFSRLPLFQRHQVARAPAHEGIAPAPLAAGEQHEMDLLSVAIPHEDDGWLQQGFQEGLAALHARPANDPIQPPDVPVPPPAEDGMPAVPIADTSPMAIRLDSQRNVLISAPESRDAQRTLVRQTLGNDKMRFQSVAGSADLQQHTLLDDSGKLLSLHSSPGSLIGLANSKANPEWRREETPGSSVPKRRAPVVTDHALTLSADESTVQITRTGAAGGAAQQVKLPDAAVLSQLTGVHQQPSASGATDYRLHNNKLYQLTSQEEGWKQVDHPLLDKEKDQASLTRQGDNALYLIHDDHHLHNLTTQTQSPRFEDKISKASVAADGQTLVLLSDDESKQQSLKWLPQPDSPAESHRALGILPRGTSLAALAQSDRHVIAASHQGRLLVASRPGEQGATLDFAAEDNQTLRNQLHQQIADVVGDRFHVEGIISGEGNQLHALVKDGMDRQHTIALNLDPLHPQPRSNWNLSDSLVMDFQKGLPQIAPGRADIVDIGSGGKLTLHDGKVHFFNETTQGWERSEVKADRLHAGQDGQAWVMKDHVLMRLKVNLSSNKINFDQNAFALHQVKKSVSEDLAMPGLDKNKKTLASAVLDSGRYLTLGENGDVHFHHVDSESRRHKKMGQTLSREALNQAMNHPANSIPEPAGGTEDHKLTDLALGPDNQLFLLSDKGKLFSLPQQSWQNGRLDNLREERLPALPVSDEAEEAGAAKPLKLHGNQKGALLLETDDKRLLAMGQKGEWRPVSSAISPGMGQQDNLADLHFERLSAATRDSRLGKTGLTFKREVNTFGQSGHDGHKVHTPFRTRLSTFVFRPTLETPRPLKNMANLIQHAHGGRQGLTPVYQQQSQQMAELKEHLQRFQATGALPVDLPLSQKLSALEAKTAPPEWLGEMQKFNATLADSAAHQASLLQRQYGKQPGAMKQQLNRLTSGMNFARTYQDDLTAKLNQLFSLHPCGEGNHAQSALAALHNDGVRLSHQKPSDEIPIGLHRDKHDPMGLVKSRLILDGLTNAKLHDLAGRLSTAMELEGDPRESALAELGEEFRSLRDRQWEENPIKQVTSQGFTGNDRLEANYDAIKSMTKAFTKENHGMNVTTRTVMQADDQKMLARRMEGTVLSMEKGESISFSRAYGAATTISGMPGTQIVAGVGGRGSLDRGYSMTLTRGEGGINVSFGRDGSGGVTAFSGFGYNLLAGINQDPAHDVHIDGERDLLPAVRLGGMVSATPLDLKKQNSVSFDITEAELPEFIDGLTEGSLNPLALLNRGINHSVTHGEVMNVSLDANIAALASAGIPITNKDEKETPASFRVGGGIYAGVNLLSGTRERGSTSKEESTSVSRSNNRPRGLNKASVGANLSLPIGVLIKSDSGRLPLFAGTSASLQLSLDNRTKQSLSLETKNARHLEPVHIDKLMESLGKNFSDPASAALMAGLKDKTDEEGATVLTPREKLTQLDAHFTERDRATMSNGQQAALRDLDKHVRQQSAADQGKKLLQSGQYQTTYANLSKVDSLGLWHQLSHLLDGKLNASNATKIRELMGHDLQLQSLIATLQDNVSTDATVTLELKDDARERLEKRWLEQGNSQQEMISELTNRENLRIKSIAFNKSQTKTDGFATPAFLLGGSNNASVSMKRSLGKINFSYGENQDSPTQYSLEGRIAKASTELASALQQGQENHFVLKG